MKRMFLGLAALALLLITTETASARPWYGVSGGWGYGGPYVGASYASRVGNNGFISVGVSAPLGGYGYDYGYPSYGYVAPAYYSTPVYAAPVYYSTPAYYTTPYYYAPAYYASPSIGFSYYSGPRYRYGRGW
jgi:hypothetical protein